MDQYGAYVLAATRSAEFAAEAALSRLAAATRPSSVAPATLIVAGHRIWTCPLAGAESDAAADRGQLPRRARLVSLLRRYTGE